MSNENTASRAYDLDETISNPNEGGEYTLLPEGEYPFTVHKIDTVRWNGSDRMPACWKKVITVEIDGGTLGKTTRDENIFLHSKCDWVISAFFTALGFRKSGEPVIIGWFDKAIGERGRCRVSVNEYTKKDGTAGKSNQVKAWLPADEVKAPDVRTPGTDNEGEDIPF